MNEPFDEIPSDKICKYRTQGCIGMRSLKLLVELMNPEGLEYKVVCATGEALKVTDLVIDDDLKIIVFEANDPEER